MIQTLIFDFGGVVFTNGTRNAVEEISSKYRVSKDEVGNVLCKELGTWYRTGLLDAQEFWDNAKAVLSVDAPSEELAEIWF